MGITANATQTPSTAKKRNSIDQFISDFNLLFKSSSLFLHFLKHFTQNQEKFKCLNFNSPLSGLMNMGLVETSSCFQSLHPSKGRPQTIISSVKPKGNFVSRRQIGFLSSAAHFFSGSHSTG